MLRQRRMASNKQSVNEMLNLYSNEMLNLYSNENLQQITPQVHNCLNTNLSISQTCRNRTSLRQIQTNQNLLQSISSNQYVSEGKSKLVDQTKCFPLSKDKSENVFFGKIKKLMKTQDVKIPVSHLNRAKSFLLAKCNRPYSSFSQRNKKVMDFSSFCQGQIVLQVDKKEETVLFQGPERMSTSRALMAFSKINRNYLGQRFKIKRDRHLYQGPICVDTQKIILHQKQRKQNNFLEISLEKSNSLTKPKQKQKQKKDRKSRYKAEQDFQIGGWEYFQ